MEPSEFKKNSIDHRLLAFSMGTLDLPKMNRSDFVEKYHNICSTFLDFVSPAANNTSSEYSRVLSAAVCRAFAVNTKDAPSLWDTSEEEQWKEITHSVCTHRTQSVQKRFFRNESINTAVSLNA
jgi:hypothetical protein